MIEKMSFETSGLVKDKDDKTEIEFWGHDAGEFIFEEFEKFLEETEEQDTPKEG